jgi:hypothetical protein
MKINRFGMSQKMFVAMALKYFYAEAQSIGGFKRPAQRNLTDEAAKMTALLDAFNKTFPVFEDGGEIACVNAFLRGTLDGVVFMLTAEIEASQNPEPSVLP